MEINKSLFELVKNQKLDEIINILNNDKMIDINIRDNSNTYLVQYAIMYNNIKLLKILIDMDCKIDFLDNEGFTILYNPIKHNYNDIIDILLNNKNIIGIPISDLSDKFGSIPLHYAINFNNDYAFNLLINESNQFNKLDSKGLSPLHYAIKKKNYNTIIKLLNISNVNINIQSSIGETPLHLACNYEDVISVELLIKAKNIQVDISDYEYQITPLMYIVIHHCINY